MKNLSRGGLNELHAMALQFWSGVWGKKNVRDTIERYPIYVLLLLHRGG